MEELKKENNMLGKENLSPAKEGFIPFKAGELAAWFFLSYLLFGPIRDLLSDLDWEEFMASYQSFNKVINRLTSMVAFYLYAWTTYTILYHTHRHRQYLLTAMGIILMLPLVAYFRYVLQEIVQRAILGFGNYFGDFTFWEYFIDNLYYGIFFPWVGGIFYFVQYSKYKEKQAKELIIENQRSQLSLLRSQINPHFLFNALNNIYSLVYNQSSQSLVAIEKLSTLLRYSLYLNDEPVSVNKELAYLQDYIDLESIRYKGGAHIEWELNEQVRSYKIAPFLLIPLVENAFKHGIANEPLSPIQLELCLREGFLLFRCTNHLAKKEKHAVGGIGLDNVKRRLELLYPQQHSFEALEVGEKYIATLKISLEAC